MIRSQQIEAAARAAVRWLRAQASNSGETTGATWGHIHNLEAALALPADDGEAVPVVMECAKTAPERIWLQISDDPDHCDEPFPTNHEDITWCQDSVMDCQVEYVRADLASPPCPDRTQGQSILITALEKLARLGNGDRYGNSDGNVIAQNALKAHVAAQADALARNQRALAFLGYYLDVDTPLVGHVMGILKGKVP